MGGPILCDDSQSDGNSRESKGHTKGEEGHEVACWHLEANATDVIEKDIKLIHVLKLIWHFVPIPQIVLTVAKRRKLRQPSNEVQDS